ncbi:serine O-acetyltransferase [Pseudomonas sp. 10B1]|uniref:serine O-acetyltransferase EpsC n=1 Tax=unclassified Pseudomonas TaxID=196821 RepID=UPI002B222854|nr:MULTISPECIES: serine O-acetyltransferase EpsC [unclassified Pseudomonas]MEA9976407.1 serine O-acetyltransferase [Pseudomonas sp. RTS4]MEA9994704.1 serine O-acetyltransferase [Pseudomonas sp. AA4]MEB0086367.1 serine O-acetyltransferase [Pseudomonas sp. RTI1]MEB0126434.1 serine O-acetyltransferase [Pseudomonas sp. CCC1.2]MEB0155864.1 serine O-acetyltransferase [Pseudomonas sp. CCC4.3]
MSDISDASADNRAGNWQLQQIVSQLREARDDWRQRNGRVSGELGGRELPSRAAMRDILEALCGALFPMRLGPVDLREESEDFYVGHTLDVALNALLAQARLELRYVARQRGDEVSAVEDHVTRLIQEFAAALPTMRILLDTDVLAAYHGDPAARSVDEVLLCYPGVLAVIHHRLAHHLYRAGLPLLARISSEIAHSATGIDIHPGAQIGGSFFIDHGTGVVIGETAIIGERVRIYQAVTLGAKRFPADEDGQLQKGHARHPIVEDDVVIYAGATILGRITIGKGSTVGGNVWLTRSVPAGCNVSQANLLQKDDCLK